MKKLCTHLFATTLGLMALCQCQSPSPSLSNSTPGSLRPIERTNYPIIEKKVAQEDGKTFVHRTVLVNENPRETFRESIQVN